MGAARLTPGAFAVNLAGALAHAPLLAQQGKLNHLIAPALVFLALLAASIAIISAMSAMSRRRQADILANGRTLRAWLVQANNALFQVHTQATPGFGYPAQFLISFDESIGDSPEMMQGLARRVGRLKGQRPKDPDERKVAKMVTNETYRPGKRERLPDSFTAGREVYAVHFVVEMARLPARCLDRPYVFCKAKPAESGMVFMIDYPEGA